MRRLTVVVMLALSALLWSCGGSGEGARTEGSLDPTSPGGPAADDVVGGGEAGEGGDSSTLGALLVPSADADGGGVAYVGVDYDKASVCVDVRPTGVATPTKVVVGENDGTVVAQVLAPTLTAEGRGCSSAEAGALERLRTSPTSFYVAITTSEFAEAAVRGQLTP